MFPTIYTGLSSTYKARDKNRLVTPLPLQDKRKRLHPSALHFSKRLTYWSLRLNGLFKISHVTIMARQLRELFKPLQPWLLAKAHSKIQAEGRPWSLKEWTMDNVVPGSPEDQSTYRSELSGLYGIVLAVSLSIR